MCLMIKSFRRVRLLPRCCQSLKTLLQQHLQHPKKKRIHLSTLLPRNQTGIFEGMCRRSWISLKGAHKRQYSNLWSSKNKKKKNSLMEEMPLKIRTRYRTRRHVEPLQSLTYQDVRLVMK